NSRTPARNASHSAPVKSSYSALSGCRFTTRQFRISMSAILFLPLLSFNPPLEKTPEETVLHHKIVLAAAIRRSPCKHPQEQHDRNRQDHAPCGQKENIHEILRIKTPLA